MFKKMISPFLLAALLVLTFTGVTLFGLIREANAGSNGQMLLISDGFCSKCGHNLYRGFKYVTIDGLNQYGKRTIKSYTLEEPNPFKLKPAGHAVWTQGYWWKGKVKIVVTSTSPRRSRVCEVTVPKSYKYDTYKVTCKP